MATYTVTGGGTALEDCIRALPGNATATNPHIIYVEPGVYSPVVLTGKETTHGAVWNSGNKYHIIIGVNRDTCIVDGGGTDVCWQYQWNWGGNLCKICNMTFRNGIAKIYPAVYTHSVASCIQLTINSSNSSLTSHLINCKICNCILPQQYTRNDQGVATAILDSALTSDCSLWGCEVCNNTCTGTSNMLNSYRAVCCNVHHNYYKCYNKAENLEAEGLNAESNADSACMIIGQAERCVVHHNTCDDSRPTPALQRGGCNESIYAFNEYTGTNAWSSIFYRCGHNSATSMTNSVIYGNIGFRSDNNSNGNYPQKIENCAIFNNTHASGFYSFSGSGRVGEKYNNATDNTTYFGTEGYSKFLFKGISDPGFVDPQNLDFRLLPNSPLIGKGRADIGQWYHDPVSTREFIMSPLTNGDLAGRPFRETPAIGAFEYYDDANYTLPALNPPMFFDPFGG